MQLQWNAFFVLIVQTVIMVFTLDFFPASELQAWLLYYSLLCLVGVLPDIYLQHFAQFSEGIYIVLGDSITPNQLSRARDLLLRFYKDFAELYGNLFYFTLTLILQLKDIMQSSLNTAVIINHKCIVIFCKKRLHWA